MVPLVVVGKLDTSCNLLVALDRQLVVVGQVTFGADMGKKVRDIAESLLPGANAAAEQLQRHDEPKRVQGSHQWIGESDDCRKLEGNGKEHCTSTVPAEGEERAR